MKHFSLFEVFSRYQAGNVSQQLQTAVLLLNGYFQVNEPYFFGFTQRRASALGGSADLKQLALQRRK
ncbi:hypothetical protein JYQ62_09815 [Nostoc sp. UHCC 0702]|nr:hypothetical protein JYQ62_09815 [Nostoc sp. UHCC 0702]